MKLLRSIPFMLGAYSIYKACAIYLIYSNGVDGSGVGIYLLKFIEINDAVPAAELPIYIKWFLMIGLALIILPIITSLFKMKKGIIDS